MELFHCPENSRIIALNSNTSATSMDDCVCNPGYRLMEGVCVMVFECPPNSTTEFALTAGGCTCADGFVPLASGVGCVELFRCPANSHSVGGLALSFVDCQCDAGFVRSMAGGECVCPLNSVKSPALNECVCVAGFTRLFSNESCVEQFRCPANSHSVDGLALSFADCKCDKEFVRSMVGGECVCPLNSVKSPDLNGCVCVAGFTRLFSNESCVSESSGGGFPIALVASVAAGGGVVLAGSVWAVANFMFTTPASTAAATSGSLTMPTVPAKSSRFSNPAAFQLDLKIKSQFIEYKV